MTVPVKQLSVPLSQNTAPVFKFDCLYTHDLVRKQKRWQDGLLAFHTFNKRVMVYDLTNNFIGDTHWRETDSVQVGDDLRLDRGVLVTVGEARGRKEQDISEIFVRRNVAAREANLPPRKVVLGRATGLRPQSITAVLEAGKNKLSRAQVAQAPSIISYGSSPYETDSQRPLKRQKLADEGSPRQVPAEKLPANRVPMAVARNHDQSQLNSSRGPKNATQGDEICSKLHTTGSERNATPKLPRAQISKGIQILEDVLPDTKKSKKKPERTKSSKSTKTNVGSVVLEDRLNEHDQQKSAIANNFAKSRSKERSTANQAKPERPKQKLTSSKSRRKKLIFNTMSTTETDQASTKEPHQAKPPSRINQYDSHSVERSSYTITKETPRDVILISSPPKEWTEFESSEDEKSGSPKHIQYAVDRGAASIRGQAGPNLAAERGDILSNKAIPDVNPAVNDQVLFQRKAVDDTDDYSGLIADENLLAALVEDPVETCASDSDPKDVELNTTTSVAVDDQHSNDIAWEDNVRLTKTIDPENLSKRTESILADSIPSSGLASHLRVDEAPTSLLQENNPVIDHEMPLSTTIAPKTPLPETNTPAAQISPPKSLNAQDPSETAGLSAQPETAAEEPTINPLPNSLADIPQPKQRALRSIAPIPALLRAPNPISAQPTTYQKPLPQFRPPQQTSIPTAAAARSRRSPLRKSLTDGKSGPVVESGVVGLTRAGSDGGIEMMGDVQREYDDTGPWTREAFDLFGWTPEVPKGKILGPVAGRGCGCRAAAAARAS